MSIIIKGMKMPETCERCYLAEYDSGFYAYVCRPTGIRIDYDMAKLDRPRRICPLVPVPPGRLIDADALTDNCMKEDDFLAEMLFRKVSNAPTIIEAEGEEKEAEE